MFHACTDGSNRCWRPAISCSPPAKPRRRGSPPGANRAMFLAYEEAMWLVTRWVLRPARAVYGLPDPPYTPPLRRAVARGETLLLAYSEALLPRSREWPANAIVTGWWFLDDGARWSPPSASSASSPRVQLRFMSASANRAKATSFKLVEVGEGFTRWRGRSELAKRRELNRPSRWAASRTTIVFGGLPGQGELRASRRSCAIGRQIGCGFLARSRPGYEDRKPGLSPARRPARNAGYGSRRATRLKNIAEPVRRVEREKAPRQASQPPRPRGRARTIRST